MHGERARAPKKQTQKTTNEPRKVATNVTRAMVTVHVYVLEYEPVRLKSGSRWTQENRYPDR